jgi:hypothetical protein
MKHLYKLHKCFISLQYTLSKWILYLDLFRSILLNLNEEEMIKVGYLLEFFALVSAISFMVTKEV